MRSRLLCAIPTCCCSVLRKTFTYTERLSAGSPAAFAATLRRVTLKHGLFASGSLVVLGLAGDFWFLARWLEQCAGRLEVGGMMRPAILFTTLLVTGSRSSAAARHASNTRRRAR
jgi:hypothetical protein